MQEAFERRGKEAGPPLHTGRVALGVPHLGLVSTESHLALAARMAGASVEEVLLSGLHGYRSGGFTQGSGD